MPELDIFNQFIENSNISKAFGLDVNGFLVLILGSFIVGYICLTFYYKVYYDYSNRKWNELNFSEKAIVSLAVGFLSIFVSLLAILVSKFTIFSDKQLDQFLLQLSYIAPFLYFIGFSRITVKHDYKGFDFVKKYIKHSFSLILDLYLAFGLIISYISRSWAGFLFIFLVILMLVITHKSWINEFLSRLSARWS